MDDKAAQTGKKARGRASKAPQPGPGDKDQINFTDEESRIMPSSEGFVQGCNAQAAVDAKRKSTVETVFGIVKEGLEFRRCHLRGLQAAQGEWNLVCMACNLKWMYALRG